MRVLILCTDAYGGHGGIALYNRDLAEALAEHELVDEIVMIPRVITGRMEPAPEKVRFVWKAARGPVSYASEIARWLGQRETFDLVFCCHINLLPVARLFSPRVLLYLHGVEAWRPRRALSTALLDSVSAILGVSNVTISRFRSWSGYTGPSFLLPPAIHLNWYGTTSTEADGALRHRLGLVGKRVLLTLGRIVAAERYKGFDEVIEVLPRLVIDLPDVVYVVAGKGGDLSRLRAKVDSLGVSDHVVFTGMVAEEEKASLYRIADVYVMPSRGEGFGFVHLEALASGTPVIASRLDGSYEAVRKGELGRAVDPSNPAEIRQAVLDSLTEPKGEVPAGLAWFAFEQFVSRIHSVVDQISWAEE